MVDIALDLNPADAAQPYAKDLLVISNDLSLTSDAYQPGQQPAATNPVLQDILQRLRFYLGEWFMDNTQGVPWFQQILVKNPDQSKIDAIFLNVIGGTPGVLQITTYNFSPNREKRILNVSFKVIATTGTVVYSGSLSPITGGQS